MRTLKSLFIITFMAATFALNAQQVGKPQGNLINFFNSTPAGGLLGHLEAGLYGQFAVTDQWIGIGQPFTAINSGVKVPAYGFRSQWESQTGIFALKNAGPVKDLSVEWGPDVNSRMRFGFIGDLLNPGSLTEIMTLTPQGRVGIGSPNPFGTLTVNTVGLGLKFGVYSIVSGEGIGVGTYGVSSSTNSDTYGVFGSATVNTADTIFSSAYGGFFQSNLFAVTSGDSFGVNVRSSINNTGATGDSYGVFSRVLNSGSGDAWAGFFDGNVMVNGLFMVSDRAFKENIEALSAKTAREKIMQLNPTTYNYKQRAGMTLDEGTQFGFIAQEVEEVFPELVKEVRKPIFEEVEVADGQKMNRVVDHISFKSINYVSLIPVLTKALQEQEETIEAQQEINLMLIGELKAMKKQLAAINGGDKDLTTPLLNSLEQNIPNPSSAETVIRYTIKPEAEQATLFIYDLKGQEVAKFSKLKKGGRQEVIIEANSLKPGLYNYVLIVDGAPVALKKMVILR